ncbi:MAG: LPS export ABC transporter permease LptG [Rhizomicrobium sp.]
MTQLDRYIAVHTLKFFFFSAVGLTALFGLLEFVEQLRFVGQGHYRLVDALAYVTLLSPAKLLQAAPVSMLLGSLLGLGGLASGSELTAMRALGISERRIAGALFKLTVPIVAGLFLMAEFVVPPAQQFAQTERAAKLSSSAPVRSGESFWAQGDGQYLNVKHFGFGNAPRGINIYTFSAAGALASYIHADRAIIRPNGTWLLAGVVQTRLMSSEFQTEHLTSLAWHSFLPKKQARLLVLPPESMPPIELYLYVRNLEKHNQPATRYQQAFWEKISIPLSMFAMILVAMPFVFRTSRAQNSGQQLAIGAIIGVVFTLIQQITAHLDLLLALNPAAIITAPPILLMIAAIYLFRRTQR